MFFVDFILSLLRTLWRGSASTELDHLKVVMNRLYQRKQTAWERQDVAWRRLQASKSAANQAAHKQAVDEFHKAKSEFNQVKQRFDEKLTQVKAEHQRVKEERKALAHQAGIPLQYLNNVWVTQKTDGTTHIYFGGVGKPAGPGHGHYVMDKRGIVTYQREPLAEHGSHNYRDN